MALTESRRRRLAEIRKYRRELAATDEALQKLEMELVGLNPNDLLRRRGRMGDNALKDIAHDCLKALTDGEACRAYKTGGRHSGTVNTALHEAHHHLVLAGAKCDAAAPIPGGRPSGAGEDEHPGTRYESASRPMAWVSEGEKIAAEGRSRAASEKRIALHKAAETGQPQPVTDVSAFRGLCTERAFCTKTPEPAQKG